MIFDLENHPDYSEYEKSREILRRHAGDVPLLFMWSIDMLQELESHLAIMSILRKQIDDIALNGISAADPDLWTENFELVVGKLMKKKNFFSKIDSAVGNWPVGENEIVDSIKKRDFIYIDTSQINSFVDIFHQIRKTRNWLAHSFFLENMDTKTSRDGVQSMENSLAAIVVDVHFLTLLASNFVGAFSNALNLLISGLIDEQK